MKKNLMLVAAVIIIMIPSVVSNAASVTTQTLDTNTTASATVQVTGRESSYEVVLPKVITADANDGALSVSYNVSVTGDIAGNEYVEVKPDASFTLKQTNKADVTASVTQSKTAFRDSNYSNALTASEVKMGTDTAGTISASDLTAGNWAGTLNFSIALKQD